MPNKTDVIGHSRSWTTLFISTEAQKQHFCNNKIITIMGKKSKKKGKASTTSSTRSNNGSAQDKNNIKIPLQKAPFAPGRQAIIRGLVTRKDLNGMLVTIKKILDNGRIAVELVLCKDTVAETREVISMKRENLETKWNRIGESKAGSDMKHWGLEVEECPICMDTLMNTGMNQNAGFLECCGKAICEKCYVQLQLSQRDKLCPLCRADISDRSVAATVKRVRARAERGDGNAMYNLGAYYDVGRPGLPRDQALARVWFERAAEAGESRGAYNLACSYRDGEGGPVDRAQAAKYFRMAGEKGHVQGITCYGLALMNGSGVERDPVEGKKWLKKGADAGDELAVQQLQMYEMMSSMGGMSFSSSPGMMSFTMGG